MATQTEIRNALVGMKFNMLTVIAGLPGSKLECRCECGNTVIAAKRNITDGRTKSCGCYRRALAKLGKLSEAHVSVIRPDGNAAELSLLLVKTMSKDGVAARKAAGAMAQALRTARCTRELPWADVKKIIELCRELFPVAE